MKISALCSQYNCPQKCERQNKPAFGHHPDLVAMLNEKSPVLTSHWFRRGFNIVEPGEDFPDVVEVFNKVLDKIMSPIRMLIVGVANSEEPLSYLATIKQIIKNKPIKDAVDLYIIDLQSKPSGEKLYKDSYYTMAQIPDYAKGSFIYDPHNRIPKLNYRVNDELFEFLYKTYNNPAKSKWETRAQEAIKTYPDNFFNVISINNVVCYMKSNDIQTTSDNMYRTLVPKGYLVEELGLYAEICKNANNLECINQGIHRKIK